MGVNRLLRPTGISGDALPVAPRPTDSDHRSVSRHRPALFCVHPPSSWPAITGHGSTAAGASPRHLSSESWPFLHDRPNLRPTPRAWLMHDQTQPLESLITSRHDTTPPFTSRPAATLLPLPQPCGAFTVVTHSSTVARSSLRPPVLPYARGFKPPLLDNPHQHRHLHGHTRAWHAHPPA